MQEHDDDDEKTPNKLLFNLCASLAEHSVSENTFFRRHIKFSHFTRCSCHSPINVAALMAKKTIYGNVPKQCILCRVESVHEIIYMNAYHKRDKLNAARTFWFVFRAYHARLSCRQTICTNTRALKNVAFPVKPDDVGSENIQIYIFLYQKSSDKLLPI